MTRTLVLALICAATLAPATHAQNRLLIPDTLSGSPQQLILREGSIQFLPGTPTRTMGANGDILGPTLILHKNAPIELRVVNQLPDTTTIHWHGLHVAPRNDGGPHTPIPPGATWTPRFTVLDHASTYWYHPHLHHRTNEHVSRGLSGFIIVRDDDESRLALPRRYGVDDFPILVQTKSFDAANQVVVHNALDTVLLVNATRDPYLEVPGQVIRLRLLNGSSERTYQFGFANNHRFHQIGSDGGLLLAPLETTRIRLSPGERAEILVDLSTFVGSDLTLQHFGGELTNGIYGAAQPGMGPGQRITGYTSNPLNGRTVPVLVLRVGSPTADAVTSVPATLVADTPPNPALAQRTRTFTFMPSVMGPTAIEGPFMINNAHFDMDVINEYVPFGTTEIWELRNETPISHPFHIHNVQFRVLDINGAPPPASHAGRKDVILVPAGMGVVRFLATFETHYDDTIPYMYHCHMLTHEDHGMMGQFIVQSPPATSVATFDAVAATPRIDAVHPHPVNATGMITIALHRAGSARLTLHDALGRHVRTLVDGWMRDGSHGIRLDVGDLAPGVYHLHLHAAGTSITRPLLH